MRQASWLFGAISFGSGLILAHHGSTFFLLIGGSLLAIALLWLIWQGWKGKSRSALFIPVVFSALAGLSYGHYVEQGHHSFIQLDRQGILQQSQEQLGQRYGPYRFYGKLQEPFRWQGHRLEGRVLITHQQVGTRWNRLHEEILLRISGAESSLVLNIASWSAGSHFIFEASLETPPGPLYPHAFDYQQYLQNQSIFWIGFANASSLQFLESAASWTQLPAQLRTDLIQQLHQVYPSSIAAILQGVLLGDRSQLTAEWKEAYEVLGIAHLLAISGLHVGTLSFGFLTVLRWLGVTRERGILLVMLFLPFYAVVTGLGPSVVRATVMAELMWLALLLRRWYDAYNGLGIAMLLLLIWDPYLLYHPGFQFSFLITGGLLFFFAQTGGERKKTNQLIQLMLITFVAQLFAFPLQIYYFHQFSWLSGLANLLAVPAYTLIVIPLGFLTLLLSFLSLPLAMWLSHLVTIPLQLLDEQIHVLAQFHQWHPFWSPPSIPWILLYYLGLILLGLMWHYRVVLMKQALFVTIWCMLLVLLFPNPLRPHEIRVTFLNVGQGDATIIESREWTILIDAGGRGVQRGDQAEETSSFDAGRQRILPYLRSRGIQHLDYVILTHQDTDHIGGFPSIAEQVTIGHLFWNGMIGREGERSSGEQYLHEWFVQHPQHRHHIVQKVQRWQLQERMILTIFPPYPYAENDNDGSLAILLSVDDLHYLFTGDMGIAAESWLIKQALPANVNMLHVGHHGSKTSTSKEFIERLMPDWAIISASKGNPFGHPHSEVLEKLQQVEAQILRTDQNGTIIFQHFENGRVRINAMTLFETSLLDQKIRR